MKENYYEEYQKIACNIKRIRKRNNLTQEKLSELTGISTSYISKIEAPNHEQSFSLDILFILSDVLNVNIMEFFEEV